MKWGKHRTVSFCIDLQEHAALGGLASVQVFHLEQIPLGQMGSACGRHRLVREHSARSGQYRHALRAGQCAGGPDPAPGAGGSDPAPGAGGSHSSGTVI